MSIALALFGSVLLLATGDAAKAASDNMLADYDVRQWRAEDGLGADIVSGVEQSLDGYIWCAARNKILRFDGQRFVPAEGAPVVSTAWRGVAVDHTGALWFYGEPGVVRYDGVSWTTLLDAGGRISSAVFNMEESTKGVMWGACANGLLRFDAPNFKPVLVPYVVEGKALPLSEMDVAPDGQVYMIAKNTDREVVVRLQDGNFHPENLPSAYQAEDALKVHIGPLESIWVATQNHFLCKSGGSWREIPLPEGPADWDGVRTLLERRAGEMWVGTQHGLFCWQEGKWSNLTARAGFFPSGVRCLKEDREGGLWAAGTVGLMRLTPKSLRVFFSGLGLEKEPYISLLQSGADWWAGIAGTPPLTGAPGDFHPAGIDAFPENVTASALLKARDGSLLIGTHSSRLWRWKDGKAEAILPEKTDTHLNSVTVLLQDHLDKIWVGTLGGLATISASGIVPVQVGDDYPRDTVNTIYEDNDGTIWVGYQTLGLLKILRDGSPVWFNREEGLPDNSVRTIYRDKSGNFWIGTAGGLVCWEKNRQGFFTTAQGLTDDGIRQIIEDDFGYLWIGTRHGLMRVSEAEFSAVSAGLKPVLDLRRFDHRDGMKSEECSMARPVKTADGTIWFPSADGLVMADPKALPKIAEAPLVSLEEVRVENRRVWSFNPLHVGTGRNHDTVIRFPAGARDISFRFTALDYFTPEDVGFRYRIEGLTADWSQAGAARTAFFRQIPPGSYRFRVDSCNRDGVWSRSDGTISFIVPPLFWQTVWFRTAGGLLGVAALVLLVMWSERRRARAKLRQVQQEQALERERARIARDIHDEVGAGLTEVALLSELAQAGLSGPEQKYLDDIFRTARDLTRSMDEIVWSINPANDTLEKLISYLVEFARDFLGVAALPCRLDVPTVVPPITVASTVRHQICLAVKETLNNIVKHAGASEARMEIQWQAGELRILIRDNGRGFEPAGIADPAATRDGLDNIASRMREIGGRCEQQSTVGKGTCTVLSVKIPAALNGAAGQ